MLTILIVVMVLMLLGALPSWPHTDSGVITRAVSWVWS
jgi:Protein of unknown function (DUF3309)